MIILEVKNFNVFIIKLFLSYNFWELSFSTNREKIGNMDNKSNRENGATTLINLNLLMV